MLTIDWKDERLAVRRLLLRSDAGPEFDGRLLPLAARHGLELGDETSIPRGGDFWIGCHPAAGWGEADPTLVGWASVVEVPVAVAALAAHDQPGRVRPVVDAAPRAAERLARGEADAPLVVRFA